MGTAPRLPLRGERLVPGAIVGDFEIVRPLGAGAMGEVFEARHVTLGKRAAIKVIGSDLSSNEEAVARFRREARAVAQLASPHIVDVFAFGELPDGRSYYVMELLAGESLRERLDRGRVPFDEALELLDQICRGLEVVHDAGIVHRDLKPENIFIARSGGSSVVKLLDFGLLKLSDKGHDDVGQTQGGIGFGTPLYASPEQLRSARDVDQRADIYSLGCVAYAIVLGRVPFPLETVAELIAAHLERAPEPPRTLWAGIPASLDGLLLAMLAKDPSKRPPIGHVQDVIAKLRDATATIGRAPSAVPIALPGSARRALPAFTFDLLACTFVVAVLVVARGGGAAASQPAMAPTPIVAPALPPDAGLVVTAITPVDAGTSIVVDAASVPKAVTHVPVDAGAHVDAPPIVPVPNQPGHALRPDHVKQPAPPDRNQTVNPFAKKHPK